VGLILGSAECRPGSKSVYISVLGLEGQELIKGYCLEGPLSL
jgi:hypothetical protein